MKKSVSKKRKRTTWTFQPDDDVCQLFEKLFGPKVPRGERTKIVNEAIRAKHAAAAMALAEKDVAAAAARLKALKDAIEGTDSQNG